MTKVFKTYELLGKGSFGKVFRGVERRTGQVVAIKAVDVDEGTDDLDILLQEITMLQTVRSNNVVQYYGSQIEKNKTELWIIMEFCAGGSLEDLLIHSYRTRHSNGLDESIIGYVLQESLKGLSYLHEQKMIHRDIKAANILATSEGEIKLADFGVAGQLTGTMQKKSTLVGTPSWMAPEVLKGEEAGGYNCKADLWSLGITAIELATGHAPYHTLPMYEAVNRLVNGPPPIECLENEKPSFSFKFTEMVTQCLIKDPAARPSAQTVLKCSVFSKKAYIRRGRHMLRALISERQQTLRTNSKKYGGGATRSVTNCSDISEEEETCDGGVENSHNGQDKMDNEGQSLAHSENQNPSYRSSRSRYPSSGRRFGRNSINESLSDVDMEDLEWDFDVNPPAKQRPDEDSMETRNKYANGCLGDDDQRGYSTGDQDRMGRTPNSKPQEKTNGDGVKKGYTTATPEQTAFGYFVHALKQVETRCRRMSTRNLIRRLQQELAYSEKAAPGICTAFWQELEGIGRGMGNQ